MGKSTQFLKFVDEGGQLQIEGESLDQKHLGEIDIVSWNWGVNDPTVPPDPANATSGDNKKDAAKAGKGQGESARGPEPATVSFTKFTDASTTRLLQAMDAGTRFPKAVLTIEERFPGADTTFHLEVQLEQALLVGFNWTAQAEQAGMSFTEEWTLNYSKVQLEYQLGRNLGAIHEEFERRPNAAGDAPGKSPPTAAEKQENEKNDEKALFARFVEYLKKQPQRVK